MTPKVELKAVLQLTFNLSYNECYDCICLCAGWLKGADVYGVFRRRT
jgi:hypothetical protein